MRIILTLLITIGLLLCSFVIWGDYFEGLLLPQSTKVQPGLNEALFTILILSLDVFLPIPVTLVIATQGNAYGLWTGCMIGVTGTTIAGTLAYLLCRVGNKRTAKFLLGQKALEPTKKLFQKHGGWAVAFSRWMAMVPEIVSCFAGLVQMPARHYFSALLCGTIPMSLTYAWLGSSKQMAHNPIIGMLLSAFIPLVLWAIFSLWMRNKESAS